MGNKDKTSVWLDLNSCLIPSGYDAGLIVPGIKKMLEDLGHHGPVTITATGDLKNIPEHVLRALFSSGINVTYVPKGIKSLFQCMLEWKSSNPPPATIMIIASIYHLHNMCVATRDDEVDKAYNFVEEPRSHFLLEKCSETSVTMDENLPGFFANAANFPAKALKVSPHISLVKNMHPGGLKQGLGSVDGNRRKDVKMIGGGTSLDSHPNTLVDFRKSKKIMKKMKKKSKKRSTK